MSIASVSTTQTPQTLVAGAAVTAPVRTAQGPFAAQVQSLLAGKSGTAGGATATAYQTEPGRGVPGKAHHPRGHHTAGTDTNAANGTDNSQTTAGVQGGLGGTGSTGKQTPGGVLLNDLMRGLHAYGATTTLA